MSKGKLYVVATPIGNLGDMTFRAVEIMKSVQVILAEDTRVTAKLLKYYEIDVPTISYRDQNHKKIVNKVKEFLDIGNDIALVSDAGTPTISDPGYKLVAELRDAGYEIITIPGASAVIAALSISGLPTDKFTFVGFLPKSETKQRKIIEQYGELDATLVIYESPYRVVQLLELVKDVLGERDIAIGRDLTKMYEEVIKGSVDDVTGKLGKMDKVKGEFVVMISKN